MSQTLFTCVQIMFTHMQTLLCIVVPASIFVVNIHLSTHHCAYIYVTNSVCSYALHMQTMFAHVRTMFTHVQTMFLATWIDGRVECQVECQSTEASVKSSVALEAPHQGQGVLRERVMHWRVLHQGMLHFGESYCEK